MHSMKLVSARVLHGILAALVMAGCGAIAANAQVYNNGTGTDHGYFYSLYSSGGSATMTFPGAGQYPGQLCHHLVRSQRCGRRQGLANGQCSDRLATTSAMPAATTTFPSMGGRPARSSSITSASLVRWLYWNQLKGSVSSDGHTYTTYEHQQVNQPSIQGTATFEQYLDQLGWIFDRI